LEGGGEIAEGILGALALECGQAQAVEGAGVARLEAEHFLEGTFGGSGLTQAQFGQAESPPSFGVLGLAQRVGGESRTGGFPAFGFDPEATEVVTGLEEVGMKLQGFLVGSGGVGEEAGAVAGDGVFVPGEGVGGEELQGTLEVGKGVGEVAGGQAALALAKGFGAGGSAAGPDGYCCQEQEQGARGRPFFRGHHRGRW
jgi:hypothetical protein